LKSKSRVDIVVENLGDVFLVERLGSGGYGATGERGVLR